MAEFGDFRIDLELTSPTGTRWRSDTLHGHLVWALALTEGPAAATDFAQSCLRGDPPFTLSDGFPFAALPKPLFPPPPPRDATVAAASAAKRMKKSPFVSIDDFKALCRGAAVFEPIETPWKTVETLHASIDRTTWTTEGEGNLYGTLADALVASPPLISVYVRTGAWDIGRVEGLFRTMALTGYGRDKSVGLGQFRVKGVELCGLFSDFETSDGFVSLSTFIPAAHDPTEGFWRTDVKRGKLGEGTGGGNPFKRPLIQFLPGSVFRTGARPRPWYGRAIPNTAPGFPAAMQLCFSMTAPCVWPG